MKITAQTAGHVSQSRPAARLPLAERIQELPPLAASPLTRSPPCCFHFIGGLPSPH